MRVLAILFLSLTASADSITAFANQNVTQQTYRSGNPVYLSGNPLLGPTDSMRSVQVERLGPTLQFGALLPKIDGVITYTFTLLGVTETASGQLNFANPGVIPVCIHGFSIPRHIYRATPGSLTINFGGTTQTFAFRVIEPVPEPSQIIFMSTGLLGIYGLVRRKLRIGS